MAAWSVFNLNPLPPPAPPISVRRPLYLYDHCKSLHHIYANHLWAGIKTHASIYTVKPRQEWTDSLASCISFSGIPYRALKVSAFLCCACMRGRMCDACSTFIPLCHQILPKHQHTHWDRHFRGQMSPSLVMDLQASKQWEPAPVWQPESPLFIFVLSIKVQIKER